MRLCGDGCVLEPWDLGLLQRHSLTTGLRRQSRFQPKDGLQAGSSERSCRSSTGKKAGCGILIRLVGRECETLHHPCQRVIRGVVHGERADRKFTGQSIALRHGCYENANPALPDEVILCFIGQHGVRNPDDPWPNFRS